MNRRELALSYGDFLLRRIRFARHQGNWNQLNNLCDRFERLHANLPPVTHPLVWHGDYA